MRNDDDDELFLREIAAYLDAQEPLLPPALLSSLPESRDAADLLSEVLDGSFFSPPLDRAIISSRASAATLPEHSSQALASGSSEAAAPDALPAPAATAPAKSRNTSRERMQSELRQLRCQHEELQRQLAALSSSSIAHALPRPQQDAMLLATWERIASRQLELRTSAEAENARLKAQLQARAAFVGSLQVSLRQLVDISDHQSASLSTPSAGMDPEDVKIYRQLIAELDDAWLQMDSVFEENGLHRLQFASSLPPQARMKARRRSPSIAGNQTQSLYIELIEAEVFPFECDLVARVSWECWDRHSASKNCVMLEYKAMEVIASTTRVPVSLGGSDVALDFIHVGRVYRDGDRICYVWRGMTKADANFPGVFIDEIGWQAMKPSSSDPESTEILTCWQLESKTRGVGNGAGNGEREAGNTRVSPLTNLVLSTAEADILQVSSKMWSMLVEDPSHTATSSR